MSLNSESQEDLLQEKQLIRELTDLSKKNPGMVAFMGYVGDPPDKEHISLYQDIFDLSKFLGIKKVDILYSIKAPDHILPFGGIILWLKKESKVKFQMKEGKEDEEDKDHDLYGSADVLAGRLGLIMQQKSQILALKRHICNP
jgi:hypothetical protein